MATVGLSTEDIQLLNETIRTQLESNDTAMHKTAADAMDEYTRMQMREDSFFFQILPPISVGRANLDKSLSHSKPYKICEREPNSPGAITVGFASQPSTFYLRADKYEVLFHRQRTPKNMIDVADLATFEMDIRQIITDNNLKDALAEKDTRFIDTCETALGGAAGTVLAATGVAQWVEISGGIARETIWEADKVLPGTPQSFEPEVMLMNNLTIRDYCKFTRDEAGGDIAQDILMQGWSSKKIQGRDVLITTKKRLVPNSRIWYFVAPSALGKHFVYEQPTMYMRKEGPMLEWYQYDMSGSAIGNVAGLACVDFTP